ncbi:MAG: hypothetical protein ACRYF0_04085 [Janthinobacterium lividum]
MAELAQADPLTALGYARALDALVPFVVGFTALILLLVLLVRLRRPRE